MATKLLNLKNPIIVFLLLIAVPFISYSQQIDVEHPLNTSINQGDNIDFGSNSSETFYIDNSKNGNNILTITSIAITNTTNFTISSLSYPFGLAGNDGTVPFTISLNGSACGYFTSTVTITHSNGDNGSAGTWTFTISATRVAEIDVLRVAAPIAVAGTDNPSEFLNIDVGSTSPAVTYTIENNGNCDLDLTGALDATALSNQVDFSVDFSATTSTISAGGSTTFSIIFNPTVGGAPFTTVNIPNTDSDENPYIFTINGTSIAPLTEGPGGVVSDLKLWLKANDGLSYTSGQSVSLWQTQARGSNAVVNTTGQEPTYRDDVTHNVNFNPVVEFSNAYTSVIKDTDFSYDDTTTQFLEGSSGFYSQDIFVVFIADGTPINNSFGFMDMFCGDADIATDEEDATGIGLGDYSGRMDDEIIMYAHSTYSTSTPDDGYAVAEIGTGSSYSNVGIINASNNLTLPQQELRYNANDIGNSQNNVIDDMINVNDTKFWIGRSEGWEASLNGRVAEVITYSARKDDTDLTEERNKIQSYLAVKYGITLGVNGTSQDYVDSDGTVIWDQSNNVGFNYDIAGIGRDDISELNQKQSKTVNTPNDLTIGLTDIYSTNNENITTNAANTFNNKEFLMWGNDNATLAPQTTQTVDMSAGISSGSINTDVTITPLERVWKVVETGTVGTAKVSAPWASILQPMGIPPGDYLMFISDSPGFSPDAEYRIMTTPDAGITYEASFDFPSNSFKYITFGFAPETPFVRSIKFTGGAGLTATSSDDYLDAGDVLDLNPGGFTISAWIKRGASSADKSIVSKRDATYSNGGFDFKITNTGKAELSWKNGSHEIITSITTIPENVWHQVAIIYDGTNAKLYIDGVLDVTTPLGAPVNATSNTESFIIAAAGKASTTAFFEGNIDEVRVWNVALSEDQLRFIMNQEIEEDTNVAGAYFNNGLVAPGGIPQASVTPTKNDIAAIPWSNLSGYYPMRTYTFTNTKDASGNGNTAALKNLTTVDSQTAPLPYVSNTNGDWDTATTWANGNMQTIPGSASIVDANTTVDWNIVQISSNVTMNNTALPSANYGNRSVLGLIVNDTFELTAEGTTNMATGNATGNGLTVTHYLGLDGKIDLEGGSQLIQTEDSDLVTSVTGELERDQQGTANSFNYNYWSSSVGFKSAGSTNTSFSVINQLLDGRNAANPVAITDFNSSPYYADNAPSGALKISSYWLWKFNGAHDEYDAWIKFYETDDLLPGEGYTMKGSLGNVALATNQNYTFRGKPNNGNFTLPMVAGNDRLIGNPYPSAMDADEFIKDNIKETINGKGGKNTKNIFNGALYFWHHFGEENSHILKEYVGGYATYTLMGGTQAYSNDSRIDNSLIETSPGVWESREGIRVPERYIPVNQGFFVNAYLPSGITGTTTTSIEDGDIVFKNSQRVFQREGTNGGNGSLFFKSSLKGKSPEAKTEEQGDQRQKIRLMFDSSNGYHRQLLVGVDENASNNFDIGYDGPIADLGKDDMYWTIEGGKFVIQGVDNFNKDQEIPLGLKISKAGLTTIKIDKLENIDDNLELYIRDNFDGETYNIKQSAFEINLEAGEYIDRFTLVFKPRLLTLQEVSLTEGIHTFMNNAISELQINKIVDTNIKSVYLYNSLGQLMKTWNTHLEERFISLPIAVSTGVYFVQITTSDGMIRKKIVID